MVERWIAQEAGNSAHEIRTWVAAFAAIAAHGRYETQQRFYRAAPELDRGLRHPDGGVDTVTTK